MARVAARAMYTALNFSVEAADKLIDNEGLTTTDDLKELDQDRVRDIVAAIRKPGGTLPPLAAGGAPRADPGTYVPERAMHNLMVAAHMSRMWDRTGRALAVANVRPGDNFQVASRQRIMEVKHRNRDSLLAPITNNDLRERNFIEFTEEVIKKLSHYRHSTGILIGHVLRPDLVPKPPADDPSTNYITHDDEAFARVRIIKQAHVARPVAELEEQKGARWTLVAIECNGEVYDHLRSMLGDTRYWSHVPNSVQVARDGRAALLAMRNNICGPTANSDLHRHNRHVADTTIYDGEKRHRGWKSFVAKLRGCFKVQESLWSAEPKKYHKFSEEEKTDFLRKGVIAPNAKAGVSTVIATKHLREDFEAAQQHIWQMIQHEEQAAKLAAPRATRNVSESSSGGTGSGRGGGQWNLPDGKPDIAGIKEGKYDRYLDQFQIKPGGYSPEEYKKLHPMARRKRYLATHNKDGSLKGGARRGQNVRGAKRKIEELTAKIESMEQALQSKSPAKGKDGGEEDEESRSNAGNLALVPFGSTRNHIRKK